jgi:ferritin-like metal-binding protein YciE
MKKETASRKQTAGARENRARSTRSANGSSNGSSNGSATRTKKTGAAQTLQNADGQQQYPSALEKLFEDLMKDMYWAEKHLVKALSTMQSQATTEELQEAFEDHMYTTQKHVTRLEKVFALLGKQAEEKKCDSMEALTKEAEALVAQTPENSMVRDAALIISAQKVEHYEIATYGSLVQLALTLGHVNAAVILEKTLWDEEDTDLLLTDIAECAVNPMADEEPEGVTAEYEMEETA